MRPQDSRKFEQCVQYEINAYWTQDAGLKSSLQGCKEKHCVMLSLHYLPDIAKAVRPRTLSDRF